jgi:aspartyl-tRNA(Asn)/glutamyl-tRNA(Gln) amidotransferase subunit B
VSIRPRGQKNFGTRVELKNINSFRNLERAVVYEVERQFQLIEAQGKVVQETRLWDADQNKSVSMRSKEEAADYRYMPEPDLLPLTLTPSYIDDLKKTLPELPIQCMDKFIEKYGRSVYDADVLTSSQDLAIYFQTVAEKVQDPQMTSNFIQTQVLAKITNVETEFKTFYPDANALADLLLKVKDKTLSLNLAKEVFEAMLLEKKSAAQIIKEKNLSQISDDSALLAVVDKIIADHPSQLGEYRSGKDKLFGFFMGQCQKALQGKGNPATLKELLEKKLKG